MAATSSGFPGNLTEIGGSPTGQPGGLITQGGAIFANAYARNLQITNNVMQNNGGAYGTVRIGTPELPAPDTDNQNDSVRIVNNRIIANAGTNLAGGIGLFAGADGYAISGNDICGNFSAEYGGGISHYGLSPNGSIHDNRIYFNQSLRRRRRDHDRRRAADRSVDPLARLGRRHIYENLIQANLANDDGGGIRFLMAGNFPMNVYNNMIVNNVSTHEGGGIALDDAPNVRLFNNTIMKNVTTATAVDEQRAAGAGRRLDGREQRRSCRRRCRPGRRPSATRCCSTTSSATTAQERRPGHGHWDRPAGRRTAIDRWDVGAFDGSGLLAPTNSIVLQNAGDHPYTTSPTNGSADPLVTDAYETVLDFAPWRTNPNFIGAILVAADLPPKVLGDYHILDTTSPAYNTGAASKAVPAYAQPPSTLSAPAGDIDNQPRPGQGAFDIGADEIPSPTADLSITKSDGAATVTRGGTTTYTIVASNAGPNTATGATLTDTFPAALTVTGWSCTATAGSSCTATGSGNNRAGVVTLNSGGSATYTATAAVSATATGTVTNTATIAAPAGVTDPNTADNTASDADGVAATPPAISLLDDFNRANANTLGANWSQTTLLGAAAIRVNTNQASALLPGSALWNGATNVFAANQGAALTFANAPASGIVPNGLFLKASGGSAAQPANYIRVGYDGTGAVIVATTTNSGGTYTTRATFAATFATGDTLAATARGTGTVDVFKTSGAVTTILGSVTIPTAGAGAWTPGTGGGRIGIQLPAGVRVDDFSGGTVP